MYDVETCPIFCGAQVKERRRCRVDLPMENNGLGYPVLTLRRADLVAADACSKWLAVFDEVCALRGDDAAPMVALRGRRSGRVRHVRDASRIRVELSPLAVLWLCLPIVGSGSAWAWLRAKGVVGGANLSRADLSRADLSWADLSWADLSWTDLSGANLSGANLTGADLAWADLTGANLTGANLTGANLTGADLTGADRLIDDAPVSGWSVAGGTFVRASRISP